MSILRRFAISAAMLIAFCAPGSAATRTFTVDAAASSVAFTLGDVLHTVRGTFQLKSGAITFDDATGHASGEMVVEAASGESGSKARDRKMKREILETDRFPEIILKVSRIEGTVSISGKSSVQLTGTMSLHGGDHAITVTVPVSVAGLTATADVAFPVPYVKWGLKNPSTLFLRVSDTVSIVVHAVGRISTAPPVQ
ncbi:MAG: YceI family protein [Acidobacteria bacterium]|nr:YceI family protein [Acidobacteriota bacterium]